MKKIYLLLAVFLCMGLVVMACDANEEDFRLSYLNEQTVAVTNDLTDWHADVTVYYNCIVVLLDGEVYKILDDDSNEIVSANCLPFYFGNTEMFGEPIWTNFPIKEEVNE